MLRTRGVYASLMDEGKAREPGAPEDTAELINRGVESLALLLELIAVLKEKGVVTDTEVGEMGKRAEQLRVGILRGTFPS